MIEKDQASGIVSIPDDLTWAIVRPDRALRVESLEPVVHYSLPEHKADHIDRLQAEGRFVCFIGEGINDSIALKKAQVSISLRSASTIATDTAQIILSHQG